MTTAEQYGLIADELVFLEIHVAHAGTVWTWMTGNFCAWNPDCIRMSIQQIIDADQAAGVKSFQQLPPMVPRLETYKNLSEVLIARLSQSLRN